MLDLGNNLQFQNKFTNNFNQYNVSSNLTIANTLINFIVDNVGFSPTMSLQIGGPAINAENGCLLADQRGANRINICDIGAYEYDGVLGLDEIIATNSFINVYPNPSSGTFYIKMLNEVLDQNTKIQIYSLDGKLIFYKKLDANSNEIIVNQKRIYILKAFINNKNYSKLTLRFYYILNLIV